MENKRHNLCVLNCYARNEGRTSSHVASAYDLWRLGCASLGEERRYAKARLRSSSWLSSDASEPNSLIASVAEQPLLYTILDFSFIPAPYGVRVHRNGKVFCGSSE